MGFKHCEPAATIIARFGGTSAVAKIVDKDESAVRRWRLPPPTGSNGSIPDDDKVKLIAAAKRRRMRLSWNDFKPRNVR